MSILARGGALMLAATTLCVLLATASAQAATGDLTYNACFTPVSASGCQQILPAEPLRGAIVSPDGKQVYVLESAAFSRTQAFTGTVATLDRAPGTQALTAGSCVGDATGCTALPAPHPLVATTRIAIAGNGTSVDVIGPSAVITFTRNATTGALTEGNCLTTADAAVVGCSQISTTALDGLTSLAVSGDGAHVWVGSSNGTFTELSQSGGALSYSAADTFTAAGPVAALALAGTDGLVTVGPDYLQSYSLTSMGPSLTGSCTNAGSSGCVGAAVGGDSVAVSPDGSSVYVSDSSAGTLETYTRNSAGALSGYACLTSTGAAGCTDVGNDSLDAPQSLTVSPDGKTIYSVGNVSTASTTGGGLVWLHRAAGGALSFAGCIEPQATAPCTTTGTTDVLDGALNVVVDPDGFSVYTVANGFNANSTSAVNALGSFVRDAPPVCTSPAPQSVLVTGTLSIPLSCRVPAGDVLTGEAIATQPTLGTVSAPSNGHVTYTPTGDRPGADSFRFTGSDDAGTSALATAAITVDYVPGVPTCQDASVSAVTGQALTLPLQCTTPAGQTSTLSITGQPTHGTLGTIDQTHDTVAYTATTPGSDDVGYVATDQDGASAAGHVRITVTAGQAAPSVSLTGIDPATRDGDSASAQVHLTINPNGAATTYNVGARNATAAPGLGALGTPVANATGTLPPSSSPQTVTVTLGGLSPYVHYQVGASATNAGGTTDSNLATVYTGAEPGGERIVYSSWQQVDCGFTGCGLAPVSDTVTDGDGNPIPTGASTAVKGFLPNPAGDDVASFLQFSGDGRHMVWATNLDGSGQLWVGPADLSSETSLGTLTDGISSLTISPDGSQVAFINNDGQLYVMRASPGANPILLLNSCADTTCRTVQVAWSPVDPNQLAVTYDFGGAPRKFDSNLGQFDAGAFAIPHAAGHTDLVFLDLGTGHVTEAADNVTAYGNFNVGSNEMTWSGDGSSLWLGAGEVYSGGHVSTEYGQPTAFAYAPGEDEALDTGGSGGLQLIDTRTGALMSAFPGSPPGGVESIAWDKPYTAQRVVLNDVARSLFTAPRSGRMQITFTNTTGGTVKLTNPMVSTSAKAFTIVALHAAHAAAGPGGCAGATLASGAQCVVDVQFKTTTAGVVDGLVYPGDPTGQMDPAAVVGHGRGFAPTVKRLRLSAHTVRAKAKAVTVTFSVPKGARYLLRVTPTACASTPQHACTSGIPSLTGTARRGGAQRLTLSARRLAKLAPGHYGVTVSALAPGWQSPAVSTTLVRATATKPRPKAASTDRASVPSAHS